MANSWTPSLEKQKYIKAVYCHPLLNTKTHQPITIKEQPLEDVAEFVYLGSNISTDGGADKDVKLQQSKTCL